MLVTPLRRVKRRILGERAVEDADRRRLDRMEAGA